MPAEDGMVVLELEEGAFAGSGGWWQVIYSTAHILHSDHSYRPWCCRCRCPLPSLCTFVFPPAVPFLLEFLQEPAGGPSLQSQRARSAYHPFLGSHPAPRPPHASAIAAQTSPSFSIPPLGLL